VAAVSQRRAYLLLAAVIVAWGINWPVMKVGLLYIPPLWFAAARVLLGCACMFALLTVMGRLRLPERRDLPVVISVGAVQIAVTLALIHFSLQFVDAGRSVILAYTSPLWVTPLAVMLLDERLSTAKVAGLVLGLGGVAVLFNPLSFDFADRPALIGNGLLLLTSMTWARVIIYIRGYRWQVSPLVLMPWQMLLGGVILSGLALWFEGGEPVRWTPTLIAVLAYNGPVASAFCFWAYVTIARALPAISTSLGSLGVPVAGMLSAAVFLGEALSATNVGGLALIPLGVVLVTATDVGKRKNS
jgi:drug/metabolite transporter (DMT)-like permease